VILSQLTALSVTCLPLRPPPYHTPCTCAPGKAVILVDDGLATGVTARAACKAMRAAGAAVTVLALPVGAARTIAEFQKNHVADLVVCLRTPKRFRAVGAHFAVGWVRPGRLADWLLG
jgi:predicted phosphoribosyltransferase